MIQPATFGFPLAQAFRFSHGLQVPGLSDTSGDQYLTLISKIRGQSFPVTKIRFCSAS